MGGNAIGTPNRHFDPPETYLRPWEGSAAVTAVLAAALIVEAFTPPTISATFFYVVMVLIGYRLPQPRAAFALALLATPFIAIGHWISIPDDSPAWESWMNRGLSVGTVWLTAGFLWRTRVLEQRQGHMETQERLAAIVRSSSDPIIGKTLHGIITSWNEAAERMFGYPAGEMIGRSIRRLIPADRQPEEDMILGRLARGERIENYETVRIAKDGQAIDVSLTISPVRDAAGRIVGASKIIRDITERKQAEDRLRESEERVRFIADRAQVGYWHWEIAADRLEWSPLCRQLFGIPPEAPMSYTRFLGALHPADRERTNRAVRACLETGGQTDYDIEYRTLWPDETVRWIHAKGSAVFADGKPVRMAGIALDITGRKQAEELSLRQADLLDQSHDAIFTWKMGGGIAYWSKGAERLYGYTAEEAIGRSSHELLRTRSSITVQELEAQIAREGTWYGELTHTRRDGSTVVVESRHSRVCYDGRRETYVLETNRDITERKAHEERVRLLVREVDHRSKNMLSVVDAIAHQTAAQHPADFVERFSARLQALSANQDLLVRNEWRGVDVDHLVRGQLAHFADLFGSRIAMHGPKLRLQASSAQAIGLALHELATNAGKYGALSTERGRVDICWGADGDTFTMSWIEREGPSFSAPKRRGFGTTVVETMAERSLGGMVDLDYPPSGVTWHLTCPAANALESGERTSSFEGKGQMD